MTGFGAAERNGFRVEVRSLNHRFLDISMKLPPALGGHEMTLRNTIKQRFGRGKLDVYVSTTGEEKVTFTLNRELAREILTALRELGEELSLSGSVTMDTLLGWKALFVRDEVSYEPAPVFEAFEAALGEVEAMRLREGEALAAEVVSRADALEALNGRVSALLPSVLEDSRQRFAEKLRGYLPEGYDEARLLQEASSVAERADISEEVSRLSHHIGHLRKILSEGGTIGRKLDFLLQELYRESNTIAAKTDDHRIVELVIDMKAETEKAREQVQNIQ